MPQTVPIDLLEQKIIALIVFEGLHQFIDEWVFQLHHNFLFVRQRLLRLGVVDYPLLDDLQSLYVFVLLVDHYEHAAEAALSDGVYYEQVLQLDIALVQTHSLFELL